MILDVLDESSVWFLGINKIFTTLRQTEAWFLEDIVALKVMSRADFTCIYHHLLLNFTSLFHASNTNFVEEYVACEEHHPLYPFILHSMGL